MGLIISRFRKKKSTIEILDDIHKKIESHEQFRKQNQERQKKTIGRLILYSIVTYIGAALIFYFYYLPPTWTKRLLHSSPLLIFPILIWLLKKFLHWYYVKRITKNDLVLKELQEEKKKILEEVMEKETYKKAREILQKYDNTRLKQLETPGPLITPKTETTGSTLRQRNVPSTSKQMPVMRPATPFPARHQTPRMGTPMATPRLPQSGGARPRALATPQMNGSFDHARGPPLPRPVLPRERSTMDRILEYLVGDGPQNRYALICKFCHSHNGMALKEEYEYVSFRCCYCYQMNLSKKQRPSAPKLEIPQSTKKQEKPDTIEECSNSDEGDEEEEESNEDELNQSDEDNTTNAAPNNSRDSGISNVDNDKGKQLSQEGGQLSQQGRQSDTDSCPQVNGVSSDEETDQDKRPS